MYAAIRQGKAKAGAAEELARRIKEGAIPIISDVEGFMAYYVVYAPDDTVTAISIFNNFAGAEEFEQARARMDRGKSRAPAHRARDGGGRAGDCSYAGVANARSPGHARAPPPPSACLEHHAPASPARSSAIIFAQVGRCGSSTSRILRKPFFLSAATEPCA